MVLILALVLFQDCSNDGINRNRILSSPRDRILFDRTDDCDAIGFGFDGGCYQYFSGIKSNLPIAGCDVSDAGIREVRIKYDFE